MGTDVIQAKYDLLDQIAARFGQQADTSAQVHSRLRQSARSLQEGWEGRGSVAFLCEMNRDVLPAVQRLTAALDQARSVTLDIARRPPGEVLELPAHHL